MEGVRRANRELKESEGGRNVFSLEESGGDYKQGAICFDVAVTVSTSDSVQGGAGVSIWAVKAGAEGESRQSQEQVSRIQFKVDVNNVLG